MDVLSLPATVGRALVAWLSRMEGFGFMAVLALRGFFGRPRWGMGIGRRVARQQIYFCGVQALPLMGLLAASVGVIVTLEGLAFLPGLGGEGLVGRLLVVVVTREVGPLLTAIIVTARSGTAMAIELGYMQVLHEVEALEVSGIDPARYLIAPRVVAATASVFGLNVFFNLVAFLAGAAVSGFAGTGRGGQQLLGNLLEALSPGDLALGLAKSLVFGAGIALVATAHGLAVRDAFTELPRAAIRTVVGCLVFCIAVNLVFSLVAS